MGYHMKVWQLSACMLFPSDVAQLDWFNFNKIVFKKTWYVSARLSISSNLQCLHNSHATLNALACIVCVKQFVMSLPAISLGDWFSGSRKGGTGGGGLVYTPKGWKQHGCVWVWLVVNLFTLNFCNAWFLPLSNFCSHPFSVFVQSPKSSLMS